MLDLGTKSSVQALGVSNLCWAQSLDWMPGLPNPCQVQFLNSSNSGFVKPSLDQVLGYLE